MSFSKSNLNSAFLLSSKPNFNNPEPQINLQSLSLNGIMPELLPFLLSNNSQLLLKNSSLSQFSKPSSFSPTAFPVKKVKTEDTQTPKPLELLQKLSGINPALASSILSETQTQTKNPILSSYHSSQTLGPLQSHQMNIGSDLKKKIPEDTFNNQNILCGLIKHIQTHSQNCEPSAHITDKVTQIKLQNLIPMAQPGLLEVQQSEIIINPVLTSSIHENIQKIHNNLNILNYQRQSLQIPLFLSQNLAFNNSDGNLNSILNNFQTNSNPVGSHLLNFSTPSVCECSHTFKESAKNPVSTEMPSLAKKKGKTYKKFIRKQIEKSEEATASSLDSEATDNSPKTAAERRPNKLQQLRLKKEEEVTRRRAEMLKNGEVENSEPELTREQVGEEAIQDFLNNVENVYSNPLNELNKERAVRLLSKFNWNIPKVLDSIKKNKSYYKKYLDGLTGN